MNATALTNGAGKSKRRELDFYPTPPPATHALMRFLDLPSGSQIMEPACGDGAMSRVMESYGHRVSSADLRFTGYGVGGIDFLANTIHPYADLRPFDAVITNPPFAQAAAFIERALRIAPTVAMLLKGQYWHAQNRIRLFEKHPPAYVLALTWRLDFLDGDRGGSPPMECIWVVWMKGDTDTKYRLLKRPTEQTAFALEAI